MIRNSLFFIVLLTLFLGCKNKESQETDYTTATKIDNTQEHPGKKLLKINCYVCHSPTASEEDRIAPPMIAVKKHYLMGGISKEDFIKSIQDFMKNPNAEDAKMYGAVKRFGVMPKANYPEGTITQIADYIYDNDIEQPEWFEEHFKQGHGQGKGHGKMMGKQQAATDNSDLSYEERGLKYAMGTKAELGKNLMGTIQKKGALEAVTFCNEAAYPLTDSMAVKYHATVKRVSDKPRNPSNTANTKEKNYIKNFKKTIAENQEPKAIIEESAETVNFYYPITTNSMCLQCHGKTIEPEVYKTIKRLYPQDQATGYGENEVRGMWSISFNK